jgi:hypothetical protein
MSRIVIVALYVPDGTFSNIALLSGLTLKTKYFQRNDIIHAYIVNH